MLTAEGLRPATLLVDRERIADIRDWVDVPAGVTLRDFGDLVLLPGLVDSHVHVDDPGRDWKASKPPLRPQPRVE